MTNYKWAKTYNIKHFQNDIRVKFKRLEDYVEEIKRSNINNSVILDNLMIKDGKTYFKSFYVYLDAMRKGFMIECRRIIGG